MRIPKEYLTRINLAENVSIELIVTDSAIIIKKMAQEKMPETFEELSKDFQGTYDMGEVDFGSPRGSEAW